MSRYFYLLFKRVITYIYLNGLLFQSLLRSFFNLTATNARASNVRLSRKNMRGNDNFPERADRFTAAAGAGATDSADSDG
jgi:hypothetical protein